MIPIGTYVRGVWSDGEDTGYKGWVAGNRNQGEEEDYLIELAEPDTGHDGNGRADPSYIPKREENYWWVESVVPINLVDSTPPTVEYRINKSKNSIKIGDTYIEATEE